MNPQPHIYLLVLRAGVSSADIYRVERGVAELVLAAWRNWATDVIEFEHQTGRAIYLHKRLDGIATREIR